MKAKTFLAHAAFTALASLILAAPPEARAAQFDIIGPAGSGAFGANFTVLLNGNFVVTDPAYDAPGPVVDVGAVYLYDGVTLAVISTLTGSTANDRIGNGGITVLSNGDFVARSTNWNNGMATNAGAVTWGSGATGVSGAVSAANSLIGSTANDSVGLTGIISFTNGDYVVSSPYWNGYRGAITWGNGFGGTVGVVSAANSLVGSTANDLVGIGRIILLNNGNYVVGSPGWDNGAVTNAGAVTWCNGTTGVTGVVSAANSLVGSTADDYVGTLYEMFFLDNGNYLVRSPNWNSSRGAVTLCSGLGGTVGVVSAANSLVGSTEDDQVGVRVTTLANGNYVVHSPYWNGYRGAITWGNGFGGTVGVVSAANSLVGSKEFEYVGDRVTTLANGNYVVHSPDWNGTSGAVTWGNGTTGVTGLVSAANSLVGDPGDRVGTPTEDLLILTNGNYILRSPYWNGDRGAVTWCNGTTGVTGVVSAANSLVGSTARDEVGSSMIGLNNGNYVVSSPDWDNGAVINAGAVTWCNGTTGVTGLVSAANSLVSSTAYNWVGSGGVSALNNGNYVVRSPDWNGDRGAVTWGNGTTGVTGVVSAANSLVGSTARDEVGSTTIGLNNGNYVVSSPYWNGSRGAATWGNGTTGMSGLVSAANSLVGSTSNDGVGAYWKMTFLDNGNYVVSSPYWDNGAVTNAGAVTWCNGTTGVTGVVSAANSLVGSTADDYVGTLVGERPTSLNNGNYLVRSPNWNSSRGAVTWGSGTSGVSGVVSATNSLVGSTANDVVGDRVTTLANGNYVVSSPYWNGSRGAATWGNGTTGMSGLVSAGNSLVGSTTNDQVGWGMAALTNGNYVVLSANWDNGAVVNAGAVTLGNGTLGTAGAVGTANSVLGSATNGGSSMDFRFDQPNQHLLVGYPAGNRVSLFGYTPEIAVEQPLNTSLADGGSRNFGGVLAGGNSNLTFTIRNTGLGELTGLGLTIDGADAPLFTITASPTAPVSGPLGISTFTVRFAPATTGLKTAALHLASNDPDENAFDLTLTGTGLTALEAWRQTYFGSFANTGDGADLNDYEPDGILNFIEYAFGLNPKQNSAGQLPQAQIIGDDFVISFTQPAGVAGITYSAEASMTLAPLSWTNVSDTGIPPQHTFSVSIGTNTQVYMRLKVSSP